MISTAKENTNLTKGNNKVKKTNIKDLNKIEITKNKKTITLNAW